MYRLLIIYNCARSCVRMCAHARVCGVIGKLLIVNDNLLPYVKKCDVNCGWVYRLETQVDNVILVYQFFNQN